MKRPRAPPSPSFSSPSSGPPVGGPDDIARGDQLDKHKKRAASGANNKKPGGIDENSETGRGNGRRSSNYRGVTRHRSSGKFEAHFWDNTYRSTVKARKGRQLYLGAYDTEEAAARAYDLAALKYWGLDASLHFPVDDYENEMEEMQKVNMKEYVAILRRRSNGFSRGSSRYRGVTRHQLSGRWEARIRKDTAGKYLYLGTFGTQEDAARAYDKAALRLKGSKAVTNFDKSLYIDGLNEGESSGSHLEQQPDSDEGNLRQEPPVQLQNSGDSHQAAAIHIPCDDEPLPLAQEMAGEELGQLQHILQVPPPLTSPPYEVALAAAPFQPIVGESLLPMAPPRCSGWQTYGADPVISCHSQVLASSPLVSSQIKIQKKQPRHLGSGASAELIIDQDPSPIYGFVLDEPPSNSLLLPNQDFCFRDVGLVPPLVPDPLYLEDESSPLGDDDYPLWEVFNDKGSEENSIDSIFKAVM